MTTNDKNTTPTLEPRRAETIIAQPTWLNLDRTTLQVLFWWSGGLKQMSFVVPESGAPEALGWVGWFGATGQGVHYYADAGAQGLVGFSRAVWLQRDADGYVWLAGLVAPDARLTPEQEQELKSLRYHDDHARYRGGDLRAAPPTRALVDRCAQAPPSAAGTPATVSASAPKAALVPAIPAQLETAPTLVQRTDPRAMFEQFDRLQREGHGPNLRRQLLWLEVRHGELVALQTVGTPDSPANYLALARSIDEAIALTAPDALVAKNRWGKLQHIEYQGIYIIGNRLVGRMDELVVPGVWAQMAKEVVTDGQIVERRHCYLDFDTNRRDAEGRPLTLPISATGEELRKTIVRATEIYDAIVTALMAIGIDHAVAVIGWMMSGNGIQLWIALANIPETPELHKLVRELLAIWSALYDSEVGHVDTKVYDPKRIGPCAGTPKRKGVKRELHRLVTFAGATEPRRLTLLELQALVAHYRSRLTTDQRAAVGRLLQVRAPQIPTPRSLTGSGGLPACNAVPIRQVAAKVGIDPDRPTCPGCGSGGSGSDVAFLDDRNLLNCKHNRCASRPNKTAVDLVAKVKFNCDGLAGTKGVASQILGWFKENFGDRL